MKTLQLYYPMTQFEILTWNIALITCRFFVYPPTLGASSLVTRDRELGTSVVREGSWLVRKKQIKNKKRPEKLVTFYGPSCH